MIQVCCGEIEVVCSSCLYAFLFVVAFLFFKRTLLFCFVMLLFGFVQFIRIFEKLKLSRYVILICKLLILNIEVEA